MALGPLQEQKLLLACQQTVNSFRSRPGYGAMDATDFADKLLAEASMDSVILGELLSGGDLISSLSPMAGGIYASHLYHLARSPDPAEKNRAYTEFSAYLYRAAYDLVHAEGGSDEQAKDAVQDTLILIYSTIDRIHNPLGFLKYGMTIVIRQCRHTLFPVHPTESLEDLVTRVNKDEEESETDSPADKVVDRSEQADTLETLALHEVLTQALKRLDNAQWRTVLVLGFWGGLKDWEIAKLLDISIQNVYIMRHRAVTKLGLDPDLTQYKHP